MPNEETKAFIGVSTPVDKNLQEGIQWLLIAANLGSADAPSALKDIFSGDSDILSFDDFKENFITDYSKVDDEIFKKTSSSIMMSSTMLAVQTRLIELLEHEDAQNELCKSFSDESNPEMKLN